MLQMNNEGWGGGVRPKIINITIKALLDCL